MPGAAFFDLDRTLLSRSSSLALAGVFRRRGLIRRRQLVKAALAQLVFMRIGASQAMVERMAERGMRTLAGVRVSELQEIVEEALEPVLKPLVYREALELARRHESAGEPAYIVSGALEQVVQALAAELGLSGALGSRCGVADGVYTGRLERALFGAAKADALDELAARDGLDLGASTAYSDSHTDLAFLERVGKPVAVNPDRALRRVAEARGWPVLRFRTKAFRG